ncbi:MAG: type II toxin-antitoxin system HipA family toxin [Alphaproteobacteria bacterium]|nr:type II toxin-antitoxin system HipA family toxin [Alphaproteobacteria bacterium]
MRELRVQLWFSPEDRREVGVLAEDRGRVWYQHDAAFAAGDLEISPVRLPRAHADLVEHRPTAGAPIPGVFNDARPEGWGLKLLHRAFQARGRAASSVSPLDELAFLGHRTMGALVFEPCTGPPGDLADAVELAALAAHAQAVWDDSLRTVLPALLRAGGPSGGARPKALIGLPVGGGPGFRFGEGELPPGWEAWLVKFPTRTDDADVGRREAAWMAMAAAAGIDVPQVRVLPLEGIDDAFAVRRFDRPGAGRRLHVLSAAGALDADFRVPGADYEHLLRATARICAGDMSQVLAMYRLAVFNVASVNHDDHLKNVAWLASPDGGWRVAPGFDLTYAPRPYGERWTSVVGEGRDVGRHHLLELARRAGIKPDAAARVIREVTDATGEVRSFLQEAECEGPVSVEAAAAVLRATEDLRA